MGRIQCEKHGLVGIELVCPHICECVDQESPLPELIELAFNDKEIGDDFTITHALCCTCLQTYGLPETCDVVLDWGYWFERLKLEPVCGSCFKEQLVNNQCNSPSST
jgi:hypothetical protein